MILALLLAVACPHPHRSRSVIDQWVKTHSCPRTCRTYVVEGGKFKVYQKCGACQVDHVCALACGGPDSPENLQWLSAKQNRAKSADCSLCIGMTLRCAK